MPTTPSCCCICGKPFKEGDYLQSHFAWEHGTSKQWTSHVHVDAKFQTRYATSPDSLKRRHPECKAELDHLEREASNTSPDDGQERFEEEQKREEAHHADGSIDP